MTHKETIKALDNLIVYLNRAVADKEAPSNLVDNVVCELKVMNISHNVIRFIANIEIERPNTFFQTCMDLQHLEIERQDKNKRSIQSIISILRTEQERHKRILEEETQKKSIELQETAIDEQKKSNVIAHKAYWWSIVATIIALASLFVAIYK